MKKYYDMLYVDNFVYIWFGWSLVCVTHFCHFAHYCYFHQLKLYIAFRKYSDPLHFFQFYFIAGWKDNCLNSIYYWKQLGYSRTFTELSLRQMCVWCCLGCVLRVTVMLEGEPSAQSEVLSAVEQVFIDIFVLCSIWLFLQPWPVSQSLPLKNTPTVWGCYQHTLLLGWYSAGDEQSWFPSRFKVQGYFIRHILNYTGYNQ